ncbi:MAG: hydantoinase B/oxoprolinase family protein [Halieaceae bacterium]|jgi:N-methylhydantoinase B|nr:hydantoinase B/oxoprolinase family protein [Halieaceae bacterium]
MLNRAAAIGIKLDGAKLAIVNARLEGVVRKMASTLLRSGRSGVLNRARDFSCCIVTHGNELLCAAESLPIHVLRGPDMMAASMVNYHSKLEAGDAFLHNCPYHGCSHPADHTILVPVVDGRGVHRYTVVAKAHQADIGNSQPTTYFGAARDVYEEGALIFPATRVQKNYQTIEDIVRICTARIRVPEQWLGDFKAMLGAARTGERALLALGAEYGWDYLEAFGSQWFDYSEARMEQAVNAMPNGRARASSTHDAISGVCETPITVSADVRVDNKLGHVHIDLRDNPDCQPNGLNVSEACVHTSAMIGLFNCLDSSVPKNAGSFRRIHLDLKENCIVGIPTHPHSCSAATTNVSDRIANAVQLAISGIGEGVGMAEIGANLPASRGVFSGVDPRSGKAYVNQVFLGSSGGAGNPHADGWLHYSHAGNGGMGYLDSIELAELYQPLYVRGRYLIPDTEGAGEYRGAPGKYVEIEVMADEVNVAYVTDGIQFPPQGVCGGEAAAGGRQYLKHADGEEQEIPAHGVLRLNRGQRLVSITSGGGGFGKPGSRNRSAVRRDVADGRISEQRARDVYGVEPDD